MRLTPFQQLIVSFLVFLMEDFMEHRYLPDTDDPRYAGVKARYDRANSLLTRLQNADNSKSV